MQTYFTLALIGAAAALSNDLTDFDFSAWKDHHKISYANPTEDRMRSQVFQYHKDLVIEHNLKYENGEESYFLALNEFAAIPNDEFLETRVHPEGWEAGTYGGINQDTVGASYCPSSYSSTSHSSSYDARSHRLVTKVKDQGSCGSCWSFAAGAAIEGAMCRAGRYNCNTWNGVSTQNLVDCDTRSHGCNGGWADEAMNFVYNTQHGIDSWDNYAYKAKKGSCAYSKSKSVGTIKSCGRLTAAKNQNAMCSMIEKKGPSAVAIDASGSKFQLYSGGLYTGGSCSSTRLNHAVTAVGFGKTDGHSSLTVKNSWGTRWGDHGYIYFARDGTTNTCGVYSEGQYAIY